MLCRREAGAGGEGIARGARTVDFKQETWEDGEFTAMNKGLPFQVRYFCLKNMHPPDFFVCANKKEFSVKVKNNPHIEIQAMRLFLIHQFSW